MHANAQQELYVHLYFGFLKSFCNSVVAVIYFCNITKIEGFAFSFMQNASPFYSFFYKINQCEQDKWIFKVFFFAN